MSRVGAIAIKKGMTAMWDDWGKLIAVTVCQIQDLQVLGSRECNNKILVKVGGVNTKSTKHCYSRLLPAKRFVTEFPASAPIPMGTMLTAAHFVPGQFVDCQAKTTGKGFQGVMKRWGFSGGNASHGASLSHRQAGSIGGCQVTTFDAGSW